MKTKNYLYTLDTHNTKMASQRLDITLTPFLIEQIDSLVKNGAYASRSEFLRDATRKLYIEIMRDMASNSVPKNYDSVKSIRQEKKNHS